MSIVRRLLPKSAFARGVSVLVGGTAGAQALMVLSSPLLTRLYTPEDFGVLAVYAGILSIIVVFGCLRYEIAIPLPKNDISAYNIMALCIMVLSFFTISVTLFVFLWGDKFLDILNMSRLKPFAWFIPVGLFFTGLYSILKYWALRKKKFKDVTLTKLHQSISMLLIQIVFFKLGAVVLVLGQAIGQGAGLIRLTKTVDLTSAIKTLRFKRIKKLAIRYKNFPIFSTWTGIFNTVGNQLPPLIFAAVFSSSAAGLYALAHRVVSMPASIIGQAVANVFLASAPEAHRDGSLDELLFKVVLTLALLAFPAGMFMVVKAEILFSLVFGENWRVAGVYAAILVPMLLMGFVTSPVTTLCAVLDKQFAGTIFQFSMMLARIVAISLGVNFSDPMLALLLFSISSAFCYLVFLLWLSSAAGGSAIKILCILCQATAISMIVLVAVYDFGFLSRYAEINALVDLLIAVLYTFIAYFMNYMVWKYYVRV